MSAKKAVHFAAAPGQSGVGNCPVAPTLDLGPAPHAPSALFHQKQSPPFRTGGRGSKQLSKAIEHSAAEKTNSGLPQESETVWVMHTRNPVYFAKYVSTNFQDPGSVLVQKMQPSHIDQALLVPWEGHLCIVKNEHLQRIEMKKEPAGWRILETPMMSRIIADLREHSGYSPVPALTPTAGGHNKRKYDDWDYVSLESSDFDEASSKASSSVFQMLGSGSAEAPAVDSVPVRQKMDLSAALGPGSASRPLTSISPAEDKVASAAAGKGLSAKCSSGPSRPDKPRAPHSAGRAPGILKGISEKPPPLARAESPGPEVILFAPSAMDSTESHASARRPPPCSNHSSALYRTPSPQNIGRVVATEPWMEDADAFSAVPRLEELSRVAAAALEVGPAAQYDDGEDTDTTVEAAEVGMGCEEDVGADAANDASSNSNINSNTTDRAAPDSPAQAEEREAGPDEKVDSTISAIESEDPIEEEAQAAVGVNTAADVAGSAATPASAAECDSNEGSNLDNEPTPTAPPPPRLAPQLPAAKSANKPPKKRRSGREAARAPELAAVLPRRRAAVQGGDYAKRNSFLGSWPSRKQSAAAGTWDL